MFNDQIIENTKQPPHLGETVFAKVINVYDADTVTVVYNINNNPTSPFVINVRLSGIDAPEKKTLNDLEKKASYLLTEFVNSKLLNKIINLEIKGWDKYGGRIVGNISLNGEFEEKDVSDWLLSKNLVKSFNGKTKKEEWSDKELNSIIDFFQK